jgi:glycopeptide antibiotics resistance protein
MLRVVRFFYYQPMPHSFLNRPRVRYRLLLLVGMIVIVPLGYGVRFSGNGWLNDFLGSVAYEVFWVFLAMFLFPKASVAKVAIAVCVATCAIEFLQLWQHPTYLAIKATMIGRLVLGSSFYLPDFLSYGVGSVVGWGIARYFKRSVAR